MSANSKIEWTDHTFNPWISCTKVSPGCDNCYAERREDLRLHRVQWGPRQPRHRTKTWRDPVRWNDAHEAFFAEHGRRQRVFCASLADVFDNAVDPQWRVDLFALIACTPNLDWLLLTKRIGNVASMLGDYNTVPLLPNIWLGATICNQEEADRDIPKLLAVPARVRFLSMEPLLGPVDLGLRCENWSDEIAMDPETGAYECCKACDFTGIGNNIDWVIAGGESGPGARPSHPDWFRSLRDQCETAGVPFLFKQWGEWVPVDVSSEGYLEPDAGTEPVVGSRRYVTTDLPGQTFARVGKKAAGRLLDGREWNEVPA